MLPYVNRTKKCGPCTVSKWIRQIVPEKNYSNLKLVLEKTLCTTKPCTRKRKNQIENSKRLKALNGLPKQFKNVKKTKVEAEWGCLLPSHIWSSWKNERKLSKLIMIIIPPTLFNFRRLLNHITYDSNAFSYFTSSHYYPFSFVYFLLCAISRVIVAKPGYSDLDV